MVPKASAHPFVVRCESDTNEIVVVVGFIRMVYVMNIEYMLSFGSSGLDAP
jgi:hypothetical protein